MKASFTLPDAVRQLTPGRPCLIVDADEVLLRFVAGLDRYLAPRGFKLDLVSFRLHGNIKRLDDEEVVSNEAVTTMLDDFRAKLQDLDEVPGASAALNRLSKDMDVVVLSNVNPSQAAHRLLNLEALGMSFPLISNSGLKGESVRALTQGTGRPSFFVDDIPQHHESVAQIAPDITRIHLVGDERLKPLLPISTHADFRANDWTAAELFILEKLYADRR